MAMQFNPYQARATLVDPTASQGGINNLLQMQQNTLSGLTDTIGNIGKTSRTNTVNDLIARGGLEGLNEAQTQARIQAEAGGTLTPEGQAQVSQLLQTAGKNDQRQFTTAERLGGEKFTGAENETKAVAKLLSEQTKAVADKAVADQKFNEDVRQFGLKQALDNKKAEETKRSNKASEGLTARGQNITAQGQKLIIQGDNGMQYYADKATGKLTPLVKGVLPEHTGSGSGAGGKGADKLTGEVRKLWDDSTGKGKLALEEMYKTGNLQALPIMKTDDKGKPYQDGTKLLYNGVPITIRNLREQLGLK